MISLIFTVLNESKSLARLLDSIARQTRLPDEVVVCDGGSRDDTLALLEAERARARFPIRVISAPGANISRGRNVAIDAARGDIIVCTDAGVVLEPDWLAQVSAPFADSRVQAVAGFFVADASNTFEVAMSATVLPTRDEIAPQKFLPSSRSVAFTKDAWRTVGGYPEWLDYCEDLLFDFAINAQCGGFAFAPTAIVHFRPRGSLRSFYRQYYLYARGDGKANLWLKRHLVRYATYLVAFPALLFAGFVNGIFWLLLVAGFAVYVRVCYQRLPQIALWQKLSWLEKIKAALWIPIIRVVGDFAKMIGYPVGVWWRMRR